MTEQGGFIVPRYKMIVSYDVRPGTQESYFRFVMNELVPTLQEKGVYMTEGWHTAYGDYPLRMIIFVAEELPLIEEVLESEEWQNLESHFLSFIENYSVRVVPYRRRFQFVR